MSSPSVVNVADRRSRLQAISGGPVAAIYLALSFWWGGDGVVSSFVDAAWIGASVGVLLEVSGGVGTIVYRWPFLALGRAPWFSEFWPLMHDENTRSNRKTALVIAYWVAILTALALYLWGGLYSFTFQQGMRTVVSVSLAVAVLTFSFLELRAHRDA